MTAIATVFGTDGTGQICGAERMAWHTANGLAARGHDVVALTTAPRPPGVADRVLAVADPEALEAARPAWVPQVVHAYDLARPDLVGRALHWAQRTGACFALTPATDPALWSDSALSAAALAAARAIFTLTRTEAVRGGVPTDRMYPIPQAPDLVGVADPVGFRRRHGITGPLVLFLGRRLPTKGAQVLRSAAELVWRRFPTATVMFAGPGRPMAPPAGYADPDHDRAGRLVDLGTLDDQTKHDALAACDVFCLPSSADVFPVVFAEAWACGRPVVSGDFPGATEVVHDGVDGLVVEPAPEPVASALIRLLSDHGLRERLGVAGARRVAREMTWDRVAAAVEAGYLGPVPGGTRVRGVAV